MIDHTPPNWVSVGFSEVAAINPANPAAIPDDGEVVSFVPMSAVEAMTGCVDITQRRQWRDVRKGYTRFQDGDVLFAKITPCMENGKVALVTGLTNGVGAGSTEFHVLRPTGAISGQYLNYYLRQETLRRDARAVMTGTAGQLRVPRAFFDENTLSLAPLPEQHRITAALDTYFSRLDAATAALERARRNLERYRASVLQAAVTGRLVPTEAELARAEGRDYEPASVLLARILKERRRRWEEAELAKLTAKGKPPTDDRWKARYVEPVGPDVEGLGELPEGWSWATVGQTTWLVRDGPHYSPKYVDEGVPFITGGNVRPAGVDFVGAKRISPELNEELSRRVKPEKGDILYTKGGTTGIARVNTYNREFNVWVHVAILKLAGLVEPFYLQHALNSQFCYQQAQRYTHGVGNQDLGLTRMVKIVIPMPPLPEQRRILQEVDLRMSQIEALEKLLYTGLSQSTRLRQSILRWAFEGRLVDQDPSDEPAAVLLGRIRAERAAAGGVGRRRGRQAARQEQLL